MDAPAEVEPYGLGVSLVTAVKGVWERIRALPPWILDAAIATVFVISSFASTSGSGVERGFDYEPRTWWAFVLIAAASLPLYLRRQFPLAVCCVSAAAVGLYVAGGFNEGTLPLIVLLEMYTIGAYCSPRRIAIGSSVVGAVLIGVWVGSAPGFSYTTLLSNVALFATSGMFGWTVQSRRLRLAALEERAEALEREQVEESRRAVADERLRIAQELHDVVAHSMSVIAVQAGAGMHVVDNDPAEAKKALANISSTSRSTLTELRRLLGVLRDDGDGATYAPAPGLDDLDHLVHEVADTGLPVDLDIDDDLGDLPPGIGFTGYRIVQEALTNVLKHAGPAEASVKLDRRGGTLRIEVTDNGRGVNGRATGTGHGLAGMRERVAVYGGTLDAGPKPGGGFRVSAELPFEGVDGGASA
jgi:signal transduction histidine kinase